MGSRQAIPKVVATEKFHKYVPATTDVHIPKGYWNGLGLNLYTFSGENDGAVPPPGIPDYGLAFLKEGSGKGNYQLNNSKWKPGKVYPKIAWYVQPHSSLGWQWRNQNLADGKPQVINLQLDAGIMTRTASEVFEKDGARVEMPNALAVQDDLLHLIALELLQEARNSTPYGMLFGETAAQFIAVQLLRKHCTVNYKNDKCKGGLPKHALRKVIEYINDRLNRNISLESLSILVGLSSYHFARQFRQSTGLAPHQYLIKCRIDKARELLKNTNMSIAQITLAVGYDSQSHFTSLFKRMVGVSPRKFRSQT